MKQKASGYVGPDLSHLGIDSTPGESLPTQFVRLTKVPSIRHFAIRHQDGQNQSDNDPVRQLRQEWSRDSQQGSPRSFQQMKREYSGSVINSLGNPSVGYLLGPRSGSSQNDIQALRQSVSKRDENPENIQLSKIRQCQSLVYQPTISQQASSPCLISAMESPCVEKCQENQLPSQHQVLGSVGSVVLDTENEPTKEQVQLLLTGETFIKEESNETPQQAEAPLQQVVPSGAATPSQPVQQQPAEPKPQHTPGLIIPKALQDQVSIQPAVQESPEPKKAPKPKIVPDLNSSNAVVFQIIRYSNSQAEQLVVDVRPLVPQVDSLAIDAYSRESRNDSPGLTHSNAEINIATLEDEVRRVHVKFDSTDQGKLFYLSVNVNGNINQLIQVLPDPVAYEQDSNFAFPAVLLDVSGKTARQVQLSVSVTSLLIAPLNAKKGDSTAFDLLQLDGFPLDVHCMVPPSCYSYATLEYQRRHGILFANYGEFVLRLAEDYNQTNIFFETVDKFFREQEIKLGLKLPRDASSYAVISYHGLAYLLYFEKAEEKNEFLLKLLRRCGKLFESRKQPAKEQQPVLRYKTREIAAILASQKRYKLWEQGEYYTEKDIQLQVDGFQFTTLTEPFNYLVLYGADDCVHRIQRVANDLSAPVHLQTSDIGLKAILITKESAHQLNSQKPIELFNLNDLDVLKDMVSKMKLNHKAQTLDDGQWIDASLTSNRLEVKMKTKGKRKLEGNYSDARVYAVNETTVLVGVETDCCVFKTKDDLIAQDLFYYFGMTASRLFPFGE